MLSISWRSLLYGITFLLFALTIGLWTLLAIGWFITEPGFEPSITLIGAIIFSLGSLLSLLRAREAKDIPLSDMLKYNPTPEQRERNRRVMLRRVHDFWIKGVLESSLHEVVRIELNKVQRPDMVDNRPWDMMLQIPGRPDQQPLPPNIKIIDIFDEVGQSLLILETV